jgi:hypothetical protein
MNLDGLGFCYSACPAVFLGRTGCGPLEIAWDTNILIDYQQHGLALWNDIELSIEDPKHAKEVEALGDLINIWAVRDVSIHLLPKAIDDAKKKLNDERLIQRMRALEKIAQALSLEKERWKTSPDEWYVVDEDPLLPNIPGQLSLLSDEEVIDPRSALAKLPKGADRELVRQAVINNMHVFLTRDAGVLKARKHLERLGLLVVSPAQLMDEMARCDIGSFAGGLRIHQGCPYVNALPVNDLQRVSHLIELLEEASGS